MLIRFKIHDRETYPDGAVLDVPNPSPRLLEACRDNAEGIKVADVLLRNERGIGYGALWLAGPTLEALAVELERVELFRIRLDDKRTEYLRRRGLV